MGFKATVLKLFIASPGDTMEERNQIEQIVHEWNDLNSEREKVMVLPIRWEKSISPEYSLSEDGQQIINKKLLINSDIIIMLFKSKLGSPTSRADSGTLEELAVFSKENAEQIGIFFCEAIAPSNNADFQEYGKVLSFRETLTKGSYGLYGTYSIKEVENFLTRQVAKYTTRLELETENQKYRNIEKDKSHIISNSIEKRTLRPDEMLLLKFMYTEGHNTIGLSSSFIYNTYSTFLKENGFKEKYKDLLEHTCDRLFERGILEFLEIEEFINPYSYESEQYPQYKLNIKTYDGLGEILDRDKSDIDELLSECKIINIGDDLPF